MPSASLKPGSDMHDHPCLKITLQIGTLRECPREISVGYFLAKARVEIQKILGCALTVGQGEGSGQERGPVP